MTRYGDIWSRPGLPLKMKSLAALAITAATSRPQEFRVHIKKWGRQHKILIERKDCAAISHTDRI